MYGRRQCAHAIPGLPSLGPYGLGPNLSVADGSASYTPPPPLPAHLSRKGGGATHSPIVTVEVNGQLRSAVVKSQGTTRVLSAERSGVPGGYSESRSRVQGGEPSVETVAHTRQRSRRQWSHNSARSPTPPASRPSGIQGNQCLEVSPKTQ